MVAHRLGCSVACEILSGQGLNLCLLHWQMDSSPLSHQGSPALSFKHVALHVILGSLTRFSVWPISGMSGLIWASGKRDICALISEGRRGAFLCKEARWLGKRDKKKRRH